MPELEIAIPARALVDVGANYQFWKMELGVNVYNVTNARYAQGGSSVAPMQQAGLWLLGHIRLKI
jgi:outer membrane receptor protein involved in Fe transport